MTVKEIVARVLRFVGREDVAEKLEKGEMSEGEEAQALETALYCYNAVEDELARCYFPLVYEETCVKSQGKFSYDNFMFKPVRLLSVTADGKKTDFKQYATYLTADVAKITVKYEYSPHKKEISGNCAFSDDRVTLKLLAAGAASEYCIINGEMQQAEFWEGVYRQEIDRIRRRKLANAVFPPRRWV